MPLQTLPGTCAVSMLAGFNAGIKAACPAPLIEIGRNAGALANSADGNIAIEDVPDFPVAINAAAAREGGHSALYRHLTLPFSVASPRQTTHHTKERRERVLHPHHLKPDRFFQFDV